MNSATMLLGCALSLLAGMGMMHGLQQAAPNHDGSWLAPATTPAGAKPRGWSDAAASVPLSPADPSLGARDAPVTLVLFSGFDCAECRELHPRLADLQREYGPQQLRIVWKNLASRHTKPTHIAAMTVFSLAGADGFWRFEQLARPSDASVSAQQLQRWAKSVGIDSASLTQRGQRLRAEKKVAADVQLARELRVGKAPTCFINGIELRGAQPLSAYARVVDAQLARAAAARERGVAADATYVELCNQQLKKKPAPAQTRSEAEHRVWYVPVTPDEPFLGNAEALVTIVQFGDLLDPGTRQIQPRLRQLIDIYGNKLRLVWKDNPAPFHRAAVPAAALAREALRQHGVAGFWKAQRLLLDNQQALNDEALRRYATQLQLDEAAVVQALEEPATEPAVAAGKALARRLKAAGTPYFFINGRRLPGAPSLERLRAMVDAEYAKAARLTRAGMAARDVYPAILKLAPGHPPPR